MKLGKLQTEWVNTLKEKPNLQYKGQLGMEDEDHNWKYCCLGMAEVILCESKGRKPNTKVGVLKEMLFDKYGNVATIGNYDDMGLLSKEGKFKIPAIINGEEFYSLASANDSHETPVSWIDIANYIESNPENVFNKSV